MDGRSAPEGSPVVRTRRGWAALRVLLGVGAVLVGAFLAVKPFASLAVLVVGIAAGLAVVALAEAVDAVAAAPGAGRGTHAVRAAVALLGAAVVVLRPAGGIHALAVAVGVVLVVSGALDVRGAWGVRGTARWNGVAGGAALVLLGATALAWPDVTVLVVAATFGAALVVAGVREVAGTFRGTTTRRRSRWPASRIRPGRWRLGANVVGMVLALVLAVVGVQLQRAAPTADAFYDPPVSVPAQPGQLLRSEPFTRGIPAGAHAWRILYTTSRDAGAPAVASGIVVVPTAVAGPSDVIAWAHGTTGVVAGCAPSVLDDGFAAGAMNVLDKVVAAGWAMVATDYVGLGTAGPHPYLVGQAAGRSVLDSVRAAHQLSTVQLSDRTVVWGHSQGGGAALWTGILRPSYAPDVPLAGVAALAPASDPAALLEHLGTVGIGPMFAAYAITGYAATYPDVTVDAYVRPGARLLVAEMAQRCLAEPGVLVSALSSIVLDQPVWQGDPDRGALHQRLVQNAATGAIDAPLLVAQGAADTLVVPSAHDAYVAARCAAGQPLDYRTYAGRGHLDLVAADSPAIADLFTWTAARFAGSPATSTCPA